MWAALLQPFLKLADPVIQHFFPDQKVADDFKLQLLQLESSAQAAQLQAELQTALAQIDVNKIEAASPNLFVSGWRPAVGWVCVLGLVYSFLLQPVLAWLGFVFKVAGPPVLDQTVLLSLLGSILGVGTLRTVDKIKGVG